MASKVQIWNLALGHLGQAPVSSDSEQTVQALALSRIWDIARQDAFSAHPWSFAIVVASLTELANFTPPDNWLYGYQYPTLARRVWKVYNPEGMGAYLAPVNNPPIYPLPDLKKYLKTGDEFRVLYDPTLNTRAIVTNVEDALCEYTHDISDTTIYEPMFVQYLGYLLASMVAMSLTGDPNMAINMGKLAGNQLAEAKRLSKAEQQSGTLGDQSTIDSRG